ncbi:MAG TPA: hypothetical protein VG078_04865 [Acidimicrobiales bacterium]|nr:hypothetical protein [Acidimicrobiales bacterium]
MGAVVEVGRDGTPGVGRAVEGMTELFAVTCPSAETCIATGNVQSNLPNWPYYQLTPAFVVISNGVPGPPQDFPRGTRQAVGIDCPTATRCLVVGRSGFIVPMNLAGRWLPSGHRYSISPGSGYPTDKISCPSSTTCYATAAGFIPTPEGAYLMVPAMMAVSADGVAVPVQVLSHERGYSADISCLFGRTCTLAVEGHDPVGGVVIDVFRGTPVAVTRYANSAWFYALSCVAPATCGVVGNMPTYAVFAWHGPVPA